MRPWAADADGHAVPSGLGVRGNVITLSVEHTAPGISYPVEVDPTTLQPPPSGTHFATLGLSTESDAAFMGSWDSDFNAKPPPVAPYVEPYSLAGMEPFYDYMIGVGNGSFGAAHIVRVGVSWDTMKSCSYNANGTVNDGTTDPGLGGNPCAGLDWFLYKVYLEALYRGVAVYPVISISTAYQQGDGTPTDAAYITWVGNLINHVDPPGTSSPSVRLWGAWNEPDAGPSSVPASTAAGYWYDAQRALLNNGCLGLTSNFCFPTLAGEFAYLAGGPRYASEYISALGSKSGGVSVLGSPSVWSYHAYNEITFGAPTSTTNFVQQLQQAGYGGARVWMTEGGVKLSEPNGGITQFFQTDGNSAAAESAAYNDINNFENIRLDPQVDAALYYAMDEGDNTFDSQLLESEREARDAGRVNANNQATPYPRPAYCALVYWAFSSCTNLGNNYASTDPHVP